MKMNTPSNISNPQSLRVLIVEDSEDDALLEICELKKGGYNPVYERVETASAMKKALKEKQWDIILCDYKMPKFSGKQAIALLKETNIDIPLIIVSDTVGEETAIECMRSGANDYVMKDSLSRLCPAIARELEDAEVRNKQRQAENALRQSEEKYRTILDEMADVYFEVDLAGNFTFFNDAIFYHVGYSREELIGTSFRYRVAMDDITNLYNAFGKIYSTGKPERSIFYKFLHKNGTMGSVEAAVLPLHNKRGEIVGFRGIARDIAERKRAEDVLRESEEKYRLIAENTADLITVTDMNLHFTYISPSIMRTHGYTVEEAMNLTLDQFMTPGSMKILLTLFEEEVKLEASGTADPGRISIVQVEEYKKDGSTIWLESSISAQRDKDNKPIGILTVNRDITERKQADEALRESERKYKSLIDNFQDIILTINLEGKITFASQNIKEKLGYESAETINMSILDFVPEEDHQRVLESLQKGMKGEKIKGFQTQVITKSGERLFFEGSFSRVYKDGAVVGAQAIIKDITESKRVAEEVLREKHFSDAVIDSLPGIFYLIDKKGQFARFNKNMADVTGYSAHELSLLSATDIIKKEDRKLIKSKIEEAFNNGHTVAEASILTKDGRGFPYYFTAISIAIEDNIFIVGMGIDITERKRAEEALRNSEEKYRSILENIQEGYYEIDLAGNLTFFNDSLCRITGYSKEELMGSNYRQYEDKGSFKRIFQAYNKVYITGEPIEGLDRELIRKDGTKRYGESSISLQKDSSGKPIGFRGLARDVTERKKMEEDLRQSEQRYRSILDEMADAYFEVDLAGKYTFLNDAGCRHLGYAREELIGTTFRGQMAKEDIGKVYDTCNRIFKTGKPEQISSYKVLRKDKTIGFTKMIVFPLKNQQGEIIGFRGVGQDVTESKRAEEERKQSFERLRKALGATVQSISTIVEMKDPYTAGHQQRVSDLARSIATEMGLSADQRDFIRTASAIHDIGKISIPAEILSKPTKLTDLEFNLIKTHAQSGHDILKDIEFPWPVADVVLQHHERMDGSGYPQGLKGNDISLEARIMAVADVVEAIASHRPYRPSLGIDFALDDITRNKGILYDADVVDACLKLFREKGYTLVFKKS